MLTTQAARARVPGTAFTNGQKAPTISGFLATPHAKSETHASGKIRDPITAKSVTYSPHEGGLQTCLTALPRRSTLVTWSLANSVGNYSWRRAGVHLPRSCIDVFHPSRPSPNPKRTQKVKMYEQTPDPGRRR